MSEPFLGQISAFGFNFAPRGWALCNGQLLPISQNTALFSLLGTYYGGDGRSTFALPKLNGMLATQQGNGPGLSPWSLGEEQGTETVTLLTTEMPMHSHSLHATTGNADTIVAAGNQLATGIKRVGRASNTLKMYSSGAPNQAMSPFALGAGGGNQPHNNMMPYLAVTYCIAMNGIFPPRQ